MGADIHAWVETKDSNHWYRVAEVQLGRNYRLFSLLAGVRGSEGPLVEPRGLPDDVSSGVFYEYYEVVVGEPDPYLKQEVFYGKPHQPRDYWHTPSYLSGREYDAVLMAYIEGDDDGYLPPLPEALGSYLGNLSQRLGGNKVRLVFWFDS